MIKPPLIWFSTSKVTGRGAGKAHSGSMYMNTRDSRSMNKGFGFFKQSRRVDKDSQGNSNPRFKKVGNRAFADRSRHGKDLGTGIGIGADSMRAKWIPLTFTGYNYIAEGVKYAKLKKPEFAAMVKKALIQSFKK